MKREECAWEDKQHNTTAAGGLGRGGRRDAGVMMQWGGGVAAGSSDE